MSIFYHKENKITKKRMNWKWRKTGKDIVKFKIQFKRILDLPMSFLNRVVEEQLDVLYYPALSGGGGTGLCKITKYIPPTGKRGLRVVLDLSGQPIDVDSKSASVFVLSSGYDYAAGKQQSSFIFVGREFFNSEEDYIYLIQTRARAMREECNNSNMYVSFEYKNGVITEKGHLMIKERLSQIISNRKEFENKKNS
jgi:hypothetical protein